MQNNVRENIMIRLFQWLNKKTAIGDIGEAEQR